MHYILSKHIDIIILFIILLPLMSGITALFTNQTKNIRRYIHLYTSIATFITLLCSIQYYISYGPLEITLFYIASFPVKFELEVYGIIFASLVSVLWILNAIYSIGYTKSYRVSKINENILFCFMSMSVACAFAVAFSANLMVMFIFVELLTLLTYPLIIESKTKEALTAGKFYLFTMVGTSFLILLPVIMYINHYAGTLNFIEGGIILNKIPANITIILLIALIIGSAKAAIFPVHNWLKKAMVAHAPVSALFHAVAVVKTGVFFIIKSIIYIFGIENLAKISLDHELLYLILLSIISWSIIYTSYKGLKQNNFKQLLAYSTITNLNYIILSAILFSSKAILIATIHMVAHALTKISLFFSAGIIYNSTKITNINDMKYLGRKLYTTKICILIASLSMVGIPPTVIFFSKFLIIRMVWQSHYFYIIGPVLIFSFICSAYYFSNIIINLYIKNTYEHNNDNINTISYKKAHIFCTISLILSSIMICLSFSVIDKITFFLNKGYLF
jgi:multicomponent Na+:H+ antiporter subunit D